MNTTNLRMAVLTLLLVVLGCGFNGHRKGFYTELGTGVRGVTADEKWTEIRYACEGAFLGIGKKEIGRHSYSDSVKKGFPVLNLKLGYGISDSLLFTASSELGEFFMGGYGFTYFIKEKAPSPYVDLAMGSAVYYLSPGAVSGFGTSIGVGYEFKKYWTVDASFAFGSPSSFDSNYGFLVFCDPDVYTGTKADVSSLSLTINYIKY